MGVDQHVAQGANLVFFIPTSIVAIITNIKQKLIKWKTALVVARLSELLEQYFGAKISVDMDTARLKMYFGIFLLIIAGVEIVTLFKKKKTSVDKDNKNGYNKIRSKK